MVPATANYDNVPAEWPAPEHTTYAVTEGPSEDRLMTFIRASRIRSWIWFQLTPYGYNEGASMPTEGVFLRRIALLETPEMMDGEGRHVFVLLCICLVFFQCSEETPWRSPKTFGTFLSSLLCVALSRVPCTERTNVCLCMSNLCVGRAPRYLCVTAAALTLSFASYCERCGQRLQGSILHIEEPSSVAANGMTVPGLLPCVILHRGTEIPAPKLSDVPWA